MEGHEVVSLGGVGHGELSEGFFGLTVAALLRRSQIRTKKIFVGGLAPTVTEHELRKYFEHYGTITDLVVMYDSSTQRPRGFGFVVYDSEDVVDRVVQRRFHQLNGKVVEVKRSIPKSSDL